MHAFPLQVSRRAALAPFVFLVLGSAVLKAAEKDEEEQVYGMGPGIVAPKVIHQVMPEYSGKGVRLDGAVLLRIVVNSKGVVKKAEVARGIARDVDECAIKAVLEWRFEPATKDAKPVAVSIDIEIRFNDM